MIYPNDSWNEGGSGWGRKSARKRERDIPYSREVRGITYITFDVTHSYMTWSHSIIRDVPQFYIPYSTRGLLNHDSFGQPYSRQIREITYKSCDVTHSCVTWSHLFIRDVTSFYLPQYSKRELLNHDSFVYTILKIDSLNHTWHQWRDSFMCDMVSLIHMRHDSILHTANCR